MDAAEGRIGEAAELKAKTAELEAKLLGGSHHDEPTGRAPFSTEIQLPVPEYPTDSSSDPGLVQTP